MAVAFKEWEVICDALARGRQALLFRKGGIHEGREGFSFAHDSFLLFPTRFHAQLEQVREGDFTPSQEWQEGEELEIRHRVEARFAVTLSDWSKVAALSAHHIYQEEVLRERFEWEGKGMPGGSIHVVLARVMKLRQACKLEYRKGFGGCRSWVDLPEPAGGLPNEGDPVIADVAFESLEREIKGILDIY